MKIIRDKLAEEIAEKEGWERVARVPTIIGTGFLLKKVLEEAEEVIEARNSTEDIITEMGDLMEVLYEIMDRYGISIEDVVRTRLEKAEKLGAFKKNYILTEIKK